MKYIIFCEDDCSHLPEVSAGMTHLHLLSELASSHELSSVVQFNQVRALEQHIAKCVPNNPTMLILYVKHLTKVHQTLVGRCLSLNAMPVVVVAQTFEDLALTPLLSCGRVTFVPETLTTQRMVSVLQLARLRFDAANINLQKLAQYQQTIATQTLMAKAKRLLQSQGLSEPEAYACLRRQAMAYQMSIEAVASRLVAAHESSADKAHSVGIHSQHVGLNPL